MPVKAGMRVGKEAIVVARLEGCVVQMSWFDGDEAERWFWS